MNINYIKTHKDIKRDKSGMSILLSILLLSSLTVITIAMSDIVLRVAKTSRQIGQSEVAYYAAETAIEKALYEIEKNYSLESIELSGNLDLGASWSVQVNSVAGDNPFVKSLTDGQSLQLDLNFSGLTLPSSVDIACSQSAKIIILNTSGQTSQICPVSGLDVSNSILRIMNEYAGANLISITPNSGDLPVGILITGVGSYQNEQRILEVKRVNWQIY